jgi:type II secretory pathway component PulF
MEAVFTNNNFTSGLSLNGVIKTFFTANTPESVKYRFWKLFQCWVTKECNIKTEISDEEIALFFDQLNNLVAAAYTVHQANGASPNLQEGKGHD